MGSGTRRARRLSQHLVFARFIKPRCYSEGSLCEICKSREGQVKEKAHDYSGPAATRVDRAGNAPTLLSTTSWCECEM